MNYSDGTGKTYSEALEHVKNGFRIWRAGWNGRAMWVVYQKGYPEGIAINYQTAKATGLEEGSVQRFLPYLMMYTAEGAFVPWTASQTDQLADDWVTELVE